MSSSDTIAAIAARAGLKPAPTDGRVFPSDTIAAIATPPGEGAIGIVRLSGPRAPEILALVFRGHTAPALFRSHQLYRGAILDQTDTPIDSGMAVWMKAPRSFTGEDLVEIQAHGGPLVLQKILAALLAAGARMAKPGEFSERAFLNGKIDLTQAEAIADMIRAKSDKALQLSFSTLAGALSARISTLKDGLIAVSAHLEAGIDFPDEDLSPDDAHRLIARLAPLASDIEALLQGFERGRILREGLRVAIVGKPNVGKSSLLNALLGEARAIVDATAGTTRDFIEESVEINGIAVRFVDTAGIRQHSAHLVEQEGIRRAKALLNSVHLVLAVFDGSAPLDDEDRALLSLLDTRVDPSRILFLRGKADLPPQWTTLPDRASPLLAISPLSSTGLKALETALFRKALGESPFDSESAVVSHLRHKESLEKARSAVADATSALRTSPPAIELAASALSQAIGALKEITGEITHEDILDRLFREFCIGK